MALHAEHRSSLSACEIYRAVQPLRRLGNIKGWAVQWDNMHDLFLEWAVLARYGQTTQTIHAMLSNIDVLVLPRARVTEACPQSFIDELFEATREYGIKTVYEIDDDFSNEYRVVADESYAVFARQCDAITVTTPYLADKMKKRFNKPTFVLPNMLDPDVWHDHEKDIKRPLDESRVVIWLSGSATHEGDWKVLENVFPALLQKHPEALLVICGYMPEYLKHVEGAIWQEGVGYRTYAGMVRQSDIVLAPVDPTDGFNMGKSPIKATEGQGAVRKIQNQLCGAAVIATDNPVYRLTIRSGYDGLLVEHTPEAWFEALDKVLTDKALRLKLQQNAYRSVWKTGKWDISRQWKLWANAYTKIGNLKRKQVALEGVKEV